MISRAHLKSFSLAFSLVLLTGCAVQEINKMGKTAREDGSNARRIMQSHMGASQPTVTWTNKQLVNLNPVSHPLTVAENKNVPGCNIIINRPDGISLPEIGQRISMACGVRVSITPDAFASLSTGSVGYVSTQSMSGKLPDPTDSGRVPLGAIPGQTGGQVQSAPVSSGTGQMTGLKWNGDLHGLLDTAASRFGLSWRMESGAAVFYRYDTQTFQLAILNTKIDSSASIDSGSGAQLGGTGNLLLEQQVQTARLQQQLRQSQSVNVNPVGTMAGPEYSSPSAQTVPDTSSGSTLQTSNQPDRVRLQEIYGRAGELRARIALPRGGSTEVHKGDVIPGSKLTVTVVTPDIVRLSDGSELTF